MDEDDLMTVSEVARYAHVGRGSVYIMMRKGRFVGQKVRGRWCISRAAYDAYRMTRHRGEDRRNEGQKIFDIEEGRFSVQMTAKILAERLGRRFTTMAVYYQIRQGRLKAHRIRSAWMIRGEDIEAYVALRGRKGDNDGQLRFA